MFSNPAAATAAAALLLAACGSDPVVTGAAAAATPPLIWQEVERVQILCLVAGPSGVDPGLADTICESARAVAAEGAPAPVDRIAIGDPAVLAPGRVTLLIHASVQDSPAGRLVAFSIRPFRASADQDSVLFGAAPRAVLLPPGGGTDPLAAAIEAALTETLPWRSSPRKPRPLGQS